MKSACATTRSAAARFLVVALVLASAPTSRARADEPAPTLAETRASVIPPDPSSRHSMRGVEVRFVLPFPVFTRPLCPANSTCILGVGAGFSVFVERRFRNGFALGGGYELGLHAAEDVHELTTLQALGARARWIMKPGSSGHPVFELGFGAILLGDVFRVATFGPYADAGFGGELEMTESLAFTAGFRVRATTFVPFDTELDDVRRSVSPYLDLLVALHAGIAWIGPSAVGR